MSKKYIAYWFSALPFHIACQLFFAYLLSKISENAINIYFSQTGEDIILNTIINKENGFYVDVGCNKPIAKSNTFLLYLKGWKGITIDANQAMIDAQKKIRKKDISICSAVSNCEKEVTYFEAQEDTVSTISENFYLENKDRWNYNEVQSIKTKTLTAILDEHLPLNKQIDLLSIDVEGVDLEVLEGIDFNKYRPKIVTIEAHGFTIQHKDKHPIYQLMKSNNYELYGFITMNAYFIDLTETIV